MRRIALRKQAQARKDAKWRREFLKENPLCQGWVLWYGVGLPYSDAATCHAWLIRNPCAGFSTDVHEIVKRSRGGSTTDPDNCIALCRNCHQFTEEYPAISTRLGLLASKRRD